MRIVTVLFLAALLAVGCSSPTGSSPATTNPATSPSPSTAPSVTLGTGTPGTLLVKGVLSSGVKAGFSSVVRRLKASVAPRTAATPSYEVLDYAVPSANAFSSQLTLLSSAPVNADGSFSLTPVTGNANHVLLVVDTSQTSKLNQVVGVLGINAGATNLIALPLDQATGTIDLGAISTSSVDSSVLQSTTSLTALASNFATVATDLSMVAAVDNGAKRVINMYINSPASGSDLAYFWYDNSTSIGSLVSTASVPGNLATCSGYGIEINFPYDATYYPSQTSNGMASAEPASSTVLFAAPPGAVTTINSSGTTTSYPTGTSITTTGTASGSILVGASSSNGTNIFAMKVCAGDMIPGTYSGHNLFQGTPPAGLWQIGIQGSQYVYTADYSLVNPIRSDNLPNILVPEIQLVTDGTGNYTGVKVRYWRWVGTPGAATLTIVPGAQARLLTEADPNNLPYSHFAYTSGSNNGYESVVFNTISLSGDWVVYSGIESGMMFQPSTTIGVNLFAWNYRLFGVRYYFAFTKP